jgi:hypothetical protein
MQEVCKSYNLGLKRKIRTFSEFKEKVDVLKKQLGNKQTLQKFIWEIPQYKLAKSYNVSEKTL